MQLLSSILTKGACKFSILNSCSSMIIESSKLVISTKTFAIKPIQGAKEYFPSSFLLTPFP